MKRIFSATGIGLAVGIASLFVGVGAWLFPVSSSGVWVDLQRILKSDPADDAFDMASMSGTWEFNYDVTQTINNAGTIGDAPLKADRIISLEFTNGQITGQVLGSRNSNICKNMTVIGEYSGKEISVRLDYPGPCCEGAKTIFEGHVTADGKIVGQHSPVEKPPTQCRLWWANVTAVKT